MRDKMNEEEVGRAYNLGIIEGLKTQVSRNDMDIVKALKHTIDGILDKDEEKLKVMKMWCEKVIGE